MDWPDFNVKVKVREARVFKGTKLVSRDLAVFLIQGGVLDS